MTRGIGTVHAIDASGGLCLTCNNAPGCYHRARRGPALFCEMFDDYTPPPPEPIIGEKRLPWAESPRAQPVVEQEVSRYSGLCVNCEHRQTCTHPKPEGGVWHCENYE